jgi:hypothetical protein
MTHIYNNTEEIQKGKWQSEDYEQMFCPICGSSNVTYHEDTDEWWCDTDGMNAPDCFCRFRITSHPEELPKWWFSEL